LKSDWSDELKVIKKNDQNIIIFIKGTDALVCRTCFA